MRRPRITTLIATTALVLAVFGTTPLGHAAGSLVLGKNSVGTAQLKKSAVTTQKIAKSAVTGDKVKNGSLLAADFKAGQLPAGPQGPKGDTGDAGAPGAQGAKGDKGDPGATTVTRRHSMGQPAGAGGYSNANVSCLAGETLVGGGAGYTWTPPAAATLTSSGPKPDAKNTWSVAYRNDGPGGSLNGFAYALCASP